MTAPKNTSALIVWLQFLGLLAGLAVFGIAVFGMTRMIRG